MMHRVLLGALAVALFLAVGGYTLDSLNDRSFMLAKVSRDACYARHGLSLRTAPEPVRTECTGTMRDYEAGRIWRYVFAAAVGATCAFLVAGGIVIVLRRRRQLEV